METTFSWHMLGGGGDAFGGVPAFATANGRVVGETKKAVRTPPPPPLTDPFYGNYVDGVSATPNQTHSTPGDFNMSGLATPGPVATAGAGDSSNADGGGGSGHEEKHNQSRSRPLPVVTPHTTNTSPCPLPKSSTGSSPTAATLTASGGSPVSRAAAAAARATVAAVRQSVIRRRGLPTRVSAQPASAQEVAGAKPVSTASRMCSTPFVIRRPPSSAGARPVTGRSTGGVGKSGPLDLTRGVMNSGVGKTSTARVFGAATAGAAPQDTPQAAGRRGPPAPVVTPAAGDKETDTERAATAAGLKQKHAASNPALPSSGMGQTRKSAEETSADAAAGGVTGDTGGGVPSDGPRDGWASGQPSSEAVLAGTATVAPVARAAGPAPAPAPAKMVVTFSAAGSLGIGMEEDETEEGSILLGGKAPTSAAALVPDGWRFTEVDGQKVRRLGGGWISGSTFFFTRKLLGKKEVAADKPMVGAWCCMGMLVCVLAFCRVLLLLLFLKSKTVSLRRAPSMGIAIGLNSICHTRPYTIPSYPSNALRLPASDLPPPSFFFFDHSLSRPLLESHSQ